MLLICIDHYATQNTATSLQKSDIYPICLQETAGWNKNVEQATDVDDLQLQAGDEVNKDTAELSISFSREQHVSVYRLKKIHFDDYNFLTLSHSFSAL